MSSEHLTGGCMCGSVRYETAALPDRTLNCHCQSCRRHTGAPMATLAVFAADDVTFSGTDRKPYPSAPNVVRAFCPECGTSLTWETTLGNEGAICAIHISSFDNPEANCLRPSAHTFYPERLSWFDAADELGRYEGFFAGGTLLQQGPASTEGND